MSTADIIAVITDWGEINLTHLCSELGCHPDSSEGDEVQAHLQDLLTRGVIYLVDGRYYGVADV